MDNEERLKFRASSESYRMFKEFMNESNQGNHEAETEKAETEKQDYTKMSVDQLVTIPKEEIDRMSPYEAFYVSSRIKAEYKP